MHFFFEVPAFTAAALELDEELDDEDVLELELEESESEASEASAFMVKAKFLPSIVAKGTLGRCTVQDIRRKLPKDWAVITPMLQSAHIITTPVDVHEVLRTL